MCVYVHFVTIYGIEFAATQLPGEPAHDVCISETVLRAKGMDRSKKLGKPLGPYAEALLKAFPAQRRYAIYAQISAMTQGKAHVQVG